MSTNNFKFENILVVLPDFTFRTMCEDCEDQEDDGNDVVCEHSTEEFDESSYREYLEDVKAQLEKIGFERCDKYNGDNSYGGTIIASWGLEDPQDGMIKYLEVVIRNGYYSGANIDWTSDGDFGVEDEDNKKQVAHYDVMNRKFDRQVARVEKILRKNGTELLKVGQFSNGEAIYQKK